MEDKDFKQNSNSKEGMCRDCVKTFPTMSCYNEGKDFMCPVCSTLLIVGRSLESPTNNGRVSPESKITRSKTLVPKLDKIPKLQRGVTVIPKPTLPKSRKSNISKTFQRAKTFAEGTHQSRDIETEEGFLSDARFSNVTLKSHFTSTEFRGCINSIWPVSPQHAWLVIKNSQVALYNRTGQLQHKVTGVHQNITDIAIDSDRNMYLVCFKERLVLKVALKSGVSISVFAQMTMTHPTEVSTSAHDKVIVSGVGVTSVRYLPGIGREYGVFIYDLHGKMIKKILRTNQEFQYPLYVGVNKHDEIAMGDYLLKKVILMFPDGREIATFDGSKTFARPFIPKGLCFDQLGNVLVANWDGGVCILLRDEGFSSVGLRFDRQFSPLSLAVDCNNELWIGHRRGGNVDIYEIDYTKLGQENLSVSNVVETQDRTDKDSVERREEGENVNQENAKAESGKPLHVTNSPRECTDSLQYIKCAQVKT